MEKNLWQKIVSHRLMRVSKLSVIFLFFLFSASEVEAATLFTSPSGGTFKVGDRITLRISTSSGTPINAISSILSIPTSLFKIESVSKSGSILNFWVTEPSFSRESGTVSFEGVTLGGFQGGTGLVATITLKALSVGKGVISFNSGQILANDGQGTDVTGSLTGSSFFIEESPIPKEEPPLPDKIEIPQAEPTLASPEISFAKKFGEPAINGSSDYPLSQTLITFVSESGIKIFIIGDTDDNGEFMILIPQTLKRGKYKVSAVVVQDDFSHSPASNEITIKIGNVFSDLGIEVRLLLIFLILLLIFLIFRAYLYMRKNRKIKIFVNKEAKEAEEKTHKYFGEVTQKFDKIKYDNVSASELENIKKVKEDLKEAEKSIAKEIKDIHL